MTIRSEKHKMRWIALCLVSLLSASSAPAQEGKTAEQHMIEDLRRLDELGGLTGAGQEQLRALEEYQKTGRGPLGPSPVQTSGPAAPTGIYEVSDVASAHGQRYERLKNLRGCARPEKECEAAAILFVEGGEEFATWLLEHYEKCLAANAYSNCGTFVRQAAHTRSETVWNYIDVKLASDGTAQAELPDLVTALGYTGDRRVARRASVLLNRNADPVVRMRLVNTLRRCGLYDDEQGRETAIAALRSIERNGSENEYVRTIVTRSLDDLERRGRSTVRSRPQ